MSTATTIVCFGETLWDVLPASRLPGGAPCNVALHLHQLGRQVQLISRVGDDELGRELLALLSARGPDSALVQRSASHLTGVVKANVHAGSQQVQYKIVQPVAWDYIQYTEAQRTAVSQARVLVYGTLAARCPVSCETLYRLLQSAAYKVLDVNLRPPHYAREVVKYLLRQADLVKLSENELAMVMSLHGQPADEATALPWLAAYYRFARRVPDLGRGRGFTLRPGPVVALRRLLGGGHRPDWLRRRFSGGPTCRMVGCQGVAGREPAAGLRRRGRGGQPPRRHTGIESS